MLRSAPARLLSLALALVALFLVAPSARASTRIVDCNSGADLQAAINVASRGDTLVIGGTCSGSFTVSKNLTLQGATGATLDSQAFGTILTISAGKVKVAGLRITSGDLGIENAGTLTLTNSLITGNYSGGAVNDGTLTVNSSTFDRNGSFLGSSGGAIVNQGPLTVKSSTFSNNEGDDNPGGGAMLINSGPVTIVGSSFTGNFTGAKGCGGAIFAFSSLTITGSTFTGNSAACGGAIVGGGTITGSTFVSNRACCFDGEGGGNGGAILGGGTIVNSTFSGNTADLSGGAIDGSGTITNSTVSGNSVTSSCGAYCYGYINGGGGINSDGTLTITNSTVSGNSALGASYGGPISGGGIRSIGTLTLIRSTVSGNAADGGGGGIYHDPSFAGSATLAASIDAGNTGGDCSSGVTSNGYNLVGADCGFSAVDDQTVADTMSAIGLKPLGKYGGKTQTMALVSTSPAVDAIPVGALATDGITPLCSASGTTDQRGKPRPLGAGCDVGAYESTFCRCTPVVIFDSMPGGYYTGGSESARTPGAFGLDEKQDVAEAFVIGGQNAVLQSFEMGLHFQQGVNVLDVYLVRDRPRAEAPGYEPDDTSVLEHWTLTNIPGSLTPTGNLVHVESVAHPNLLAGHRYWFYISVSGPATAIGWISGTLGSGPFTFAARNSANGFQWVVGDAHETYALRVTALQ